ncbi:MAG: type I-C CRISPR-associated protein Cas8c/Csd1 [Acidobacteriia bacterium]|nr:type I-C CRISPR-associated protein Cas8c/Csd1 [Terriglobia bacterium]MYD53212.1 type I-C CRISPR-associated protein Cas8c/Csd1 [Chloroflexota bacterium]
MLLAKLKEYADERIEDPAPALYASTPVALVVPLRPDGTALPPIERFNPSSARGRRGVDMLAPEVQRSSAIKPLLLADNGEYTFGRARDANKQDRTDRAHAAYLELLERCAIATEEPAVTAVRRFYERGGVAQLDLADEWDYGLKVTFEVHFDDGTHCRPIDLPSVQAFWHEHNEPDLEASEQCHICGERRPAVKRMQAKIKGIRGGQSSGTSIISANAPAFESYGLEASRVAPTCQECGTAFTRGLNDLLADDQGSMTVGDATFVFWTRRQESFDFASLMRRPDAAQVGALLESVRRGLAAPLHDSAAFYAASLSASGGRAVVRDWIDTTVGSMSEHIARWFVLQRIIDPRDEDPSGAQPRPLSLFQLAVSTVRQASDLPVTTPGALFRSALSGTPVPLEIGFQAVRRCRAEQSVCRFRAALIKLVLLSRESQPTPEDYMVALDSQHPSSAYHCGRLLAVIEEVQRAALPNVSATIVDRYYGAASSTPAVVFGALLRGAQPHLARLERDRPGAHVALQRRIEEVTAEIGDWPTTLALKDQALFALGYYHQRAHSRAQFANRRTAQQQPVDQSDDSNSQEN